MILYTSRHGAIREYVDRIRTDGDARGHASLAAYDIAREARPAHDALKTLAPTRVLVIAPIYAGRIPGRMRRFLDLGRSALERHTITVALSCLYEGEQAREQLVRAYPAWLVSRAERTYLIGGRIRRGDLSWPMRFLISKVVGRDEDIDTLRFDRTGEIARWLRAEEG